MALSAHDASWGSKGEAIAGMLAGMYHCAGVRSNWTAELKRAIQCHRVVPVLRDAVADATKHQVACLRLPQGK